MESYSIFDIAKTGCIGPVCIGKEWSELRESVERIVNLPEGSARGDLIYCDEGPDKDVRCDFYPVFEIGFHVVEAFETYSKMRLYIPEKECLEDYYSDKKNEFNSDIFDIVNFRIDYEGLYSGQKISECDQILSGVQKKVFAFNPTGSPDKERVYRIENNVVLFFDEGEDGGELVLMVGLVMSPSDKWWTMLREISV